MLDDGSFHTVTQLDIIDTDDYHSVRAICKSIMHSQNDLEWKIGHQKSGESLSELIHRGVARDGQ